MMHLTRALRILVALPRLVGLFGTRSTRADALYIGDGADDTVKHFDAPTGAYLGTFVAPGGGGLHGPRGMIFSQGHFYVANQNVQRPFAGEILQYSGRTGRFLGALVPCNPPLSWDREPNAPWAPRGLLSGPGSTLYVADPGDGASPGRVLQFETTAGDFVGELDTTGFRGSFYPRGLVLGPDDLLYVSASGNLAAGDKLTGYVLRFHPHTGRFVDVFISNPANHPPAGRAHHLHRPEGLVFGPDGNLYVTAFRAHPHDTDKILIFDSVTGAYVDQIDLDQVGHPRAFAIALLFGPGGYLFVPITGNGPETGAVRRYDITASAFPCTHFVPPRAQRGPLGQPWYLTFGQTNPTTLDCRSCWRSQPRHS